MKEWEALYRDQVANARIVIFSKRENESPEVLADTEKAIRKINPDAEILSRHYTLQDDEWWRSVMALSADDIEASESEGDVDGLSQITLT